MPELFVDLIGLVEAIWSLTGPIGLVAVLAGLAAHHFADADLEDAAGRERVREALHAGGSLRRIYVH